MKQEFFIGNNRALHVYKEVMQRLTANGYTIQSFAFSAGDGLIVVNCHREIPDEMRDEIVERLMSA